MTGILVLLAGQLLAGALIPGYDSVEIRAKEASRYAAHQESQNLIIAAHPCQPVAKVLISPTIVLSAI